jgi:hypothetical protein
LKNVCLLNCVFVCCYFISNLFCWRLKTKYRLKLCAFAAVSILYEPLCC